MKFSVALSSLLFLAPLALADPSPEFFRAVDRVEFYRNANGIAQRNMIETPEQSHSLQRRCAKSGKHRHRKFAHPHHRQQKPAVEKKKSVEKKKVKSSEARTSQAAASTQAEAKVEVKTESQAQPVVKAQAVVKTTSSVKPTSSNTGKGFFANSGAIEGSTKDSGPNGAEWYLNSGFGPSSPDAGWNPPFITLQTVKMLTLDDALKMENSVYEPCREFLETFDSIGASTGLGSIVLAAIAMQESTCNANVMGDNGGAYGLMQITSDKCGGAPNGNCNDPYYNIKTGAEYLKSRLDANGGDLLVSLGEYNGWKRGLTYNQAIAIKGSCCQCQNNGDYMQQMLNGWLQGVAGYNLGTIRNLDSC